MSEFMDYDRIVDSLPLYIPNFSLDFVVVLSTKDKDGNRSFFHTESVYNSKYNDTSTGRSIRRRMSFYFVLNNKNNFDGGFVLRPQDVQILNMAMDKTILPWFFTKRIFSIVENKLVITGDFEPFYYNKNEYQGLRFDPTITEYEDNVYKEGIRLTVNNGDYVDMDIDTFMAFYYYLHTDMCVLASTMAMYAKTAPYDVNVWKKYGLAGAYNSSNDDSLWNSKKLLTSNSENAKNFFDNIPTKRE